MTRKRKEKAARVEQGSEQVAGEPHSPGPDVPRASSDIPGKWAAVALLFITAAGLLFRLYRLEVISFWNDEALQLNGIMMSVKDLLRIHLRGADTGNPPLSFMIQRLFWLPTQTKFAARLPGAILGTLMIPLSYWMGRRSVDRVTGLGFAFFTALSFFLIWFSQECRNYIFWGFTMWLTIALTLDLGLSDPHKRFPIWKWLLICISGLLCSGMHANTLMFLPVLGVFGVLLMALHLLKERSSRSFRLLLWRAFGLAIVLIIPQAASWLFLRFGSNWDLFTRIGLASGGYRPPLPETVHVFLKYSWGNGWRVIPFLAVLGCSLLTRERRVRECAAIGVLFFLISVAMWTYVYPIFTDPHLFSFANKYLFWSVWPVLMLLALGMRNLLRLAPSRLSKSLVLAAAILAFGWAHWPIYSNYYRMEARTGNYAELKRQAESVPDHRLMVLGNAYDMQYLRHYWPTNCTHAAPPICGNRKTYVALGISNWIDTVVHTYPNVVFHHFPRDSSAKSMFRNLSPALLQEAVTTNGTEMVVTALGMSPNEIHLKKPYTFRILYNLPEDLVTLAATTSRDLLLFPGHMPLVTTRDGNGDYRHWRLLDRPSELVCINPHALPRTVTIPITAARLSQDAVLILADRGGQASSHSLPRSSTLLADMQTRQWVSRDIGINDALNISHRLPMRMETATVHKEVRLEPGRSHITMIPRQAPILIGPPPPEFTLVGIAAKGDGQRYGSTPGASGDSLPDVSH